MNRSQNRNSKKNVETVRCAIYTRVSTSEGLSQDFNTLDNQREAAEAYIVSQKNQGWISLPDRYDDGGFTGGNMERPALRRLLRDIEDGKLDVILVYKIDRLSRSLIDFAQLIELFDRYNVSFVSVTQQFATNTPMGRLMLNILLSFAQYERELTAERTRDKMVAARRKGKWTGGMPMLGYDIAPEGGKLIINKEEAIRIREIFNLYLEYNSLIKTARELNNRGWTTKQWITKSGKNRGGKPFSKTNLHSLLKNPIYIGKIKYRDEWFEGEHDPIIYEETWNRVQILLRRNGVKNGKKSGSQYNSLLKGLLYCASCGTSMIHTYTLKNWTKQYRYYVCTRAQKEGWDVCPSKSISAPEIERFVIDKIRCAGKDPALIAETFDMVIKQNEKQIDERKNSQRVITETHKRYNTEMRFLMNESKRNGNYTSRLVELQDAVLENEKQLMKIQSDIKTMENMRISREEIMDVMAQFDPIWDNLSLQEQFRIVHLLVEKIEYDGEKGSVVITFRPSGIKTLAKESESHHEGV